MSAANRPQFFVAVGASGGDGLHDLRDLLETLPAELPAVLTVVLHRPSNRISHLQQVLARRSALPVVIPQEADEYRAGVCYIGEPAAHLCLAERSRVHLIAAGTTNTAIARSTCCSSPWPLTRADGV